MRANKLFIAITSAAMLAVLPAAHAADTGGAATANQPVPYLDDAAITTKVKAKFLADKVVSGIKIKVETMQGVVHLSGQAKSDAEKQRATELAMATEGVKDVKNLIEVK